MNMPGSPIEAIKVLRNLPVRINTVEVETVHYGKKEYQIAQVDLGLIDAKHLVEAIMAFSGTTKKEDYDRLVADFNALQEKYWNLRHELQESLHKN